jgi:hypothetical protein
LLDSACPLAWLDEGSLFNGVIFEKLICFSDLACFHIQLVEVLSLALNENSIDQHGHMVTWSHGHMVSMEGRGGSR